MIYEPGDQDTAHAKARGAAAENGYNYLTGGSKMSTDRLPGQNQFNDHHMQIRIAIPNDYSCTSDCWWTIEVTYAVAANDTTTWSARIEGNSVKLVE